MNAPLKLVRPVEEPTNATAKRDAAIRDVRDRFYRQWLKICADMQAEISRIEREFS